MGGRVEWDGMARDAALEVFAGPGARAESVGREELRGAGPAAERQRVHRYCSGATVPEEFAVVERLALWCGPAALSPTRETSGISHSPASWPGAGARAARRGWPGSAGPDQAQRVGGVGRRGRTEPSGRCGGDRRPPGRRPVRGCSSRAPSTPPPKEELWELFQQVLPENIAGRSALHGTRPDCAIGGAVRRTGPTDRTRPWFGKQSTGTTRRGPWPPSATPATRLGVRGSFMPRPAPLSGGAEPHGPRGRPRPPCRPSRHRGSRPRPRSGG